MARKGRTAMVSIAIFIGVTGTIALFSMRDILIGQLKQDIKENELMMAQVSLETKEGVQPDNVAALNMLDRQPGVTEVQAGMEDRPVYFKTSEDAADFEDGFVQAYVVLNADGTQLVDAPFDTEAKIEPYRLLEGGAWPAPHANELLIERRMADEYKLKVGDTLYMRVLSPSHDPERNGQTGTVEAWNISGIVFDPYGFSSSVSIYTRFDDGMYLAGLVGFNDIWLRFTDYGVAQDRTDVIVDLIARQTAYSPAFVETQDPAQNSLVTNAELFANLMSFLALIALIVSGFLVINVISSLVNEQKRQIGVMKSIGATRWDNFFMYSGIAFAYGVIGVTLGVIVGIPAGNFAAHALGPQLNTLIEGFRTSPSAIITGILVGLLVPVLASLIPVFNGTRVQILDAMTDLGIDANYGSGLMARIIGRLPVPITVRQGLSNVSLKKGRLTFTVITLAVAVGAFMGIFALFESLTGGIQVFFDSWNIHAGVFPSEPRDPQQVVQLIEDNFGDQIQTIQPGFFQQIEFEGYKPEVGTGGPPGIFAYGYDINSDDPAFLFTLKEGQKLTPENAQDGIILSSLLAANMDKKVGDAVVLKVPGNSQQFTIVGIADFPIEQAWAAWDVLAVLRDSTIDTIQSDSLIPVDSIPLEARGFVKYMTVAQVDGYESAAAGPLPGTMVMGFSPSVAQFLQVDSGEFLTVGQPGILISQAMATNGGYSVGDTLKLTSLTPNGTVGGISYRGYLHPTPGDARRRHHARRFHRHVLERCRRPRRGDGDHRPTAGWLLHQSAGQEPIGPTDRQAAEEHEQHAHKPGRPLISFNFVDLTQQISDAFLTIQAILSAVAGLIALVGALGLLTTLSMSVFERQKEIGVMRSIGAGSSTVAVQFLTEGLVVGVIAWLVGIPLMILIQYALLNITGFSETFPFQFSPTAVVIGLIGMLVVTTIASLWPSLGAARKTVSDILRYQ